MSKKNPKRLCPSSQLLVLGEVWLSPSQLLRTESFLIVWRLVKKVTQVLVSADLLSTESADPKVSVRCDKSERIRVVEVRKSDAMDGERWHVYAEITRREQELFFFLLLAFVKTPFKFCFFFSIHSV